MNKVLPARDPEIRQFSVDGACFVEKSMRCVRINVNTTKCEVRKKASLNLSPWHGSTCMIVNMDCRPCFS